ncbi:uncharacterized protein B0I36DRAFT_77220 [Microdochium trichocladiopsis]|uniref:Uncharacterized protein n=1 Tax=Microdochium trichocladiopsis TaxID=1682393 RepID=A0A9P9BYP1_9PEZI|nr:uncharacterized protein B0I36DRAFT_77220 [Microdochium trichocladiopsis]KAH7038233.1 hypothetical protein B0I36DRAFT_77220 [Microdochium trichocladiopsis]
MKAQRMLGHIRKMCFSSSCVVVVVVGFFRQKECRALCRPPEGPIWGPALSRLEIPRWEKTCISACSDDWDLVPVSPRLPGRRAGNLYNYALQNHTTGVITETKWHTQEGAMGKNNITMWVLNRESPFALSGWTLWTILRELWRARSVSTTYSGKSSRLGGACSREREGERETASRAQRTNYDGHPYMTLKSLSGAYFDIILECRVLQSRVHRPVVIVVSWVLCPISSSVMKRRDSWNMFQNTKVTCSLKIHAGASHLAFCEISAVIMSDSRNSPSKRVRLFSVLISALCDQKENREQEECPQRVSIGNQPPVLQPFERAGRPANATRQHEE